MTNATLEAPAQADQILLHENVDGHRTYVTVLPCDAPKAVVAVQFSTTYVKGKNPDEHRIQHRAIFTDRDELKLFIDHLSKYL